jgi:transcriptional regulator with XRE-family HTH domain
MVLVDELVYELRTGAGLSLRRLAELSDVAVSTVHRIERGELRPTVDTLGRIVAASGRRLVLDAPADYGRSILGLGLAIRGDLEAGDSSAIVRKTAELVHHFEICDGDAQSRILQAEPPSTGAATWDALLGGVAEWLAVSAGIEPPDWAMQPGRFLERGWWITPMTSMRAWEYAGTPVSLQHRGVFIHRDSLTNR